jgi:hypothetical protein
MLLSLLKFVFGGSPKGAVENLNAVFSALPHAISLVNQFSGHSHPTSHKHPQETTPHSHQQQ